MISSRSLDTDVVVVAIDRPEKLNALTREMIESMRQELIAAAPAAAGVVVAGRGRSFSAGVDLREFVEGTESSGRALITSLAALCATARTLPIPVACAIQGHCLGGALEFAACCDFRVATGTAVLGMPEVYLGIPSVIDAAMLERHIGTGRAREMLLTGDPIDGETAHRWGLVNRICRDDEVIEVAANLVRHASRHGREVIASQKALHEEWLNPSYADAVERSVEALVAAFASGRPQKRAAEGRRDQD